MGFFDSLFSGFGGGSQAPVVSASPAIDPKAAAGFAMNQQNIAAGLPSTQAQAGTAQITPPAPSTLPVPTAPQSSQTPSLGSSGQLGTTSPFNIQNNLSQLSNLDPKTRAMLGIGLTEAQQTSLPLQQDALTKLTALQNQLAQASAPSEEQSKVNELIKQTQQQLLPYGINDPNYRGYYNQNQGLKDVGITQNQLQNQVNVEREPITQSLANLILSKSILGEQQQRNITNLQVQGQQQQNNLGLIQSLASLFSQGQKLPEAVGSKILENSLAPQITSHIETIGTRKVMVNTNQYGQVTGTQDLGEAPANIFSYANTPGGQAITNSILGGTLAPNQVTSRNAPILGNALLQNPNFNAVQAQAAADFLQANGTQQTLARVNSLSSSLDGLVQASLQVPRTELPALNAAILAGKEFTGSPQAVALSNLATRTASELGQLLGGGAGSDFRQKLGNALLSPNFSQAQLEAAVGAEKQLLQNLSSAFQQQGGQTPTGITPLQNQQPAQLSVGNQIYYLASDGKYYPK